MSWFTKNGIYEKVALYCIDKSPLIVDKDKLTCKDGTIIMKDVRINHRINKDNDKGSRNQETSHYDEVNGLFEQISLEISSNGLRIEFEGTELLINGSDPSIDVNQIKDDLMKSVNLMKENMNSYNEEEEDEENDNEYTSHNNTFHSSTSVSSTNTDLNRQNSMSSVDSFGYTKSVMLDIASSFMGSLEDFRNTSNTDEGTSKTNEKDESKKFDKYYDDTLPEDLLVDDNHEPPRSIMDSFKNKIVDMALSNFQLKFTDTRLLLANMDIIIDIETMEAKSKENERFLDFFGIKIINNADSETNDNDPSSDEENMMSSSVYMSAVSSFSRKFDQESNGKLEEFKTVLFLEEISFYFISNNDPKKLIPEEIIVSPFTIEYDGMKFQVDSFVVYISKSINKYTLRINELIFELHSENIDKKGYKFELLGIEYGNFVKNQHNNEAIPTFDTFTVQKYKISHRNMNLTSKKSKSGNEAIIIIFKDTPSDKSIEFKFKTLELVSKAYRLNSGVVLKVPRVFFTYHNNKIKGAIKTFSISLIESFKKLNTVNDAIIVDNISFQFSDKTLNLNIDGINGNFCCDSFHCFVQTMMDISYTETFPDDLKYEREPVNGPLNLVDMLLGEDFFNPGLIQNDEDFIDIVNSQNNESNTQKHKAFKFKKNFLRDLINKKTTKPLNRTDLCVNNDPLSKFNLNLQLDRLSLKLYDGYHFDYTKKLINENISTLKNEYIENTRNDSPNVLFNSIYISPNSGISSPDNVEKSGYLDDFVFTNRSLPFLGKSQETSGEIIVESLKINFENMTPDFDSSTNLKDEKGYIASRFCLSAKNLDILDKIKSSTFNKFLTSFKSPQLDHSCFAKHLNLIEFELETIRPDAHLLASDLKMKLKTLPLKLHINEDFVDFLMRFFTFKDVRFELIDEYPEEIFIRKFEIEGMNISIDYKSKEGKQDEESQKFRSIFLNKLRALIVVENCDIKLKHLIIYGIDSGNDFGRIIQDKWFNDIVNSQRLALLGGVSPLKSAMNLSSAVKTLIEQPIQQSSKVGWTRSIQNGFFDFGKTTTNELLKLGADLSLGTQNILEATETSLLQGNSTKEESFLQKSIQAEGSVLNDDLIESIGPNSSRAKDGKDYLMMRTSPQKDISKRAEIRQPETFREGLSQAYSTLGDNFNIALQAAMKTKTEIRHTENNSEATKLLLNSMGVTLLRPLIGATGALNKSLQGLQGQLQDEEVTHYINQKLSDKYKS